MKLTGYKGSDGKYGIALVVDYVSGQYKKVTDPLYDEVKEDSWLFEKGRSVTWYRNGDRYGLYDVTARKEYPAEFVSEPILKYMRGWEDIIVFGRRDMGGGSKMGAVMVCSSGVKDYVPFVYDSIHVSNWFGMVDQYVKTSVVDAATRKRLYGVYDI